MFSKSTAQQLIAYNNYNSEFLTLDQRKLVVAMYLLGYRIADIAKKVGGPTHHVYNYLRQLKPLHGLLFDETFAIMTPVLDEYTASVIDTPNEVR